MAPSGSAKQLTCPAVPEPSKNSWFLQGWLCNKLIDRAELVFGDKIIEPEYVGAAPRRVGVTAIRFQIADPLPQAATIEMKARVNGHDSNTVLLPLE